MRRLAWMVLLALSSGCLEQGSREPPAGDLRSVIEAHLAAYVARDVDAALAFEHDPWVDLGGGSCPSGPANTTSPVEPRGAAYAAERDDETPTATGPDTSCDPANVTREERRAMLADAFAREDYRAGVEGKTVRDLFDLDAMREQDAAAYLANLSLRTHFRAEPGDVAVHVPAQEGSRFYDGWFRIYGERDGRWVSVAGD